MDNLIDVLIVIFVSGIINYFISRLFVKKNVFYVFIIPAIVLIISGLIFLYAFFGTTNWGSVIFLILAFIGLFIFTGTILSSLILFFQFRKKL